jgi:chromosome segregation ATPase
MDMAIIVLVVSSLAAMTVVWFASYYSGKKVNGLQVELSALKALKAGTGGGTEELAAKNAEIRQLSAQLADMQGRQEAYEKKIRDQLAGKAAERELSEKRLAQLKETEKGREAAETESFAAKKEAERAGAELAALKKESDRIVAEMDTLKAKAAGGAEAFAAKDAEIKRLSGQLADMQSRQEVSESALARLKDTEKAEMNAESEALAAKRDAENARAELDRLKNVAARDAEGLAAKDAEIKRLSDQLADALKQMENSARKLAEFKKMESDAEWLGGEIEEFKKTSHDMKRRIEESRMKMRLLSEKSKENVELLASFAEGKEFDEFRKAIHLDELVQKYEDEIKELRIRNMDLEKRVGSS